jgi:hypothetical protein
MRETNIPAKTPRPWVRRAKLIAGALALTSGVFTAGLSATVSTAYAAGTFPPVVTQAYTITPSTASVQSPSVNVTPTSFGATGSYTAMFTTPVAIPSGDSITISTLLTSSGAPGYDWAGVTNVGVVDVTAGNSFGAATVATTSISGVGTTSLSIPLPKAGINAGDTVEVTFQATNPSSAGPYSYNISTTASPTPVETSSSVTFGPLPLTVSASNQEIGASATYTFTNLTANASTTVDSIELTATGTVVFASVASDYTVTNATTSTTDTVTGVSLSNSDHDATLTLQSDLLPSDSYTVTADGTNPTSPETDTFTVVLLSGTTTVATETATPQIGFGLAVGNVSVSPSPATAGVSSTYTVSFASTDGLVPGGTITITAPTGTDFTNSAALVEDTSTSQFQVVSGSISSSGNQITLTVPGLTIAKGNLVTVTLYDVTNPKAGSYAGTGGLEVTTTNDPLASYNATAYVIATPAPSNVVAPTVTVTPNGPGAVATYVVSPFKAASNLVAGTDTIEVQGPSGTIFPGSGYTLTDETTSSGTQALSVKSLSNGDSDVVLNLANNINAGDVLSLTITDVVNPPAGSTSDTLSLGADSVATNTTAANTQGLEVEGVPFPNAGISYPNGAIVSFAGTDYVFAGGMPFAVGSELSALQKVDPAKVISAPAGVTVPQVKAPAPGTLVKPLTPPGNASPNTIYVVGTDGSLYGFASTNQLADLGYDAAVNVTVPSVGSLTVATPTAGAANVTALDTLATGAIINTSPTFYVLAGGHAFGIPGPKALALVQKTDKAMVLKGSLPASATATGSSATVMDGTLITAAGITYVAYKNELYSFVSSTELANDGFGGTAAVTAPNTGGLSVVPRPYGTS